MIRTLPGFNLEKTVFFHDELCSHVGAYITDNYHRLIDARNPSICHVENDMLGDVFQVKAFHKSQLSDFIRSYVLPYEAPEPFCIPTPPMNPQEDCDEGLISHTKEKSLIEWRNLQISLKNTNNEKVIPDRIFRYLYPHVDKILKNSATEDKDNDYVHESRKQIIGYYETINI